MSWAKIEQHSSMLCLNSRLSEQLHKSLEIMKLFPRIIWVPMISPMMDLGMWMKTKKIFPEQFYAYSNFCSTIIPILFSCFDLFRLLLLFLYNCFYFFRKNMVQVPFNNISLRWPDSCFPILSDRSMFSYKLQPRFSQNCILLIKVFTCIF